MPKEKGDKPPKYAEVAQEYEMTSPGYNKPVSSVDTTPLSPPPPDAIVWISLFCLSLSAFIVGLTGLLTPNYMKGEIDMREVKPMVTALMELPENYTVPDYLKMADFGLFRFCFSDDFMIIVDAAMSMGTGEMPENEGGMKLDFSEQCHEVIETENQPQTMKDRTRQGKILMFMGLSSVFVTWLFVILVLIAGRHLSKVITAISASVSVLFLVTSLLVSMTLRGMTKDYLNLEIMKSVRTSLEDMGIRIDFIESSFQLDLNAMQPVDMQPGYSGFLIVTSAILMMIIGITSLLKIRSHEPG